LSQVDRRLCQGLLAQRGLHALLIAALAIVVAVVIAAYINR
jgi:hypothetical protein